MQRRSRYRYGYTFSLAELGRIESKVVKEANQDSTLVEIASQAYKTWVEAAENKINDSWRIFADAQISAQEGRHAVLENLCGFFHHLADDIRRYLWRLRTETLEEKGQNQGWKWNRKTISKTNTILPHDKIHSRPLA
jgi:hypothetical protein